MHNTMNNHAVASNMSSRGWFFAGVPDAKKAAIVEQLVRTQALGLRAIILKELTADKKAEFEQVVLANDESLLVDFGNNHVKDFARKYEQMIGQIVQAYFDTIQEENR